MLVTSQHFSDFLLKSDHVIYRAGWHNLWNLKMIGNFARACNTSHFTIFEILLERIIVFRLIIDNQMGFRHGWRYFLKGILTEFLRILNVIGAPILQIDRSFNYVFIAIEVNIGRFNFRFSLDHTLISPWFLIFELGWFMFLTCWRYKVCLSLMIREYNLFALLSRVIERNHFFKILCSTTTTHLIYCSQIRSGNLSKTLILLKLLL